MLDSDSPDDPLPRLVPSRPEGAATDPENATGAADGWQAAPCCHACGTPLAARPMSPGLRRVLAGL